MIIKALLKSFIVSTTVLDNNRVKTYVRSSSSCLLSGFFDLEAIVSARQLLRLSHVTAALQYRLADDVVYTWSSDRQGAQR